MLIKSSSKLQFIWPVGVFHRISMGWLNQVAVEMGTEQRACCLVFDTHLKGPVLSFCSCACGGLQLPAYFWGVLIASSLPPGKTPTPALPPLFLSSSPPPLAHQLPLLRRLLLLTPFFCLFLHSKRPLRAAGLSRSLLRWSELITCIPDRRATWGHTLPEDRSIRAGGNGGTGARGLRLQARSGAGWWKPQLKPEQGGNGLDDGTAAAWAWRPS